MDIQDAREKYADSIAQQLERDPALLERVLQKIACSRQREEERQTPSNLLSRKEPLSEYSDVLSAAEVAQILRVSKRAVYDYLDSGALYSFRLTTNAGRPMRHVFIPKQALLDYIQGRVK